MEELHKTAILRHDSASKQDVETVSKSLKDANIANTANQAKIVSLELEIKKSQEFNDVAKKTQKVEDDAMLSNFGDIVKQLQSRFPSNPAPSVDSLESTTIKSLKEEVSLLNVYVKCYEHRSDEDTRHTARKRLQDFRSSGTTSSSQKRPHSSLESGSTEPPKSKRSTSAQSHSSSSHSQVQFDKYHMKPGSCIFSGSNILVLSLLWLIVWLSFFIFRLREPVLSTLECPSDSRQSQKCP
jgi:hypothetical protein